MRYFKVKARTVGGINKKIHRAKEIVREDGFPAGAIEDLIEGGFIVPCAAPAESTTEVVLETTVNDLNEAEVEVIEVNESKDEETATSSEDNKDDDTGNKSNETEADPTVRNLIGAKIKDKTHKDFKKVELQQMCDDLGYLYSADDTKAVLFGCLVDGLTK